MRIKEINSRFLEDWRAKEISYVNSIIAQNHQKKSIRELLQTLFPEIPKKEYHSNFFFNSPITTQIPFSTKLIVDVRPYKNETEFDKYYGLDIKEFARLVREGYIIPQFGSDIHRYEGMNYLKPIFLASDNPSSNLRTDALFNMIDTSYDNTIKLVEEKLFDHIKEYWQSSGEDLKSYFHDDFDAFLKAWVKRLSRIYAISPYFGKILLSLRGRKDFLQLINIFTTIFVFPITKSLGGAYRTSFENHKQIQMSLLKTEIKRKKIIPFSEDIAVPICKSIEAKLPLKMNITSLSRYLNDDLVLEANKLMFEIENTIMQGKVPDGKRSEALRDVWTEISQMIEKNEQTKNTIKRALNIGVAAIIGITLWKKFDFNALIYGVIAREIFKTESEAFIEDLSTRFTEMLSKTFQPNHVILFNDYMKNVKDAVPKIYLS